MRQSNEAEQERGLMVGSDLRRFKAVIELSDS